MLAAKTPSLELIQIASPCTNDWGSMSGDDRVRHCGDCQLNVYNLAEMTREEATAFLAQREGRTCIRMFKRADGTVITRDCPIGLAAVRSKIVRTLLATAGLFLTLLVAVVAALGRIPGAQGLLAEGKIERVRERYFPALTTYSGFLGDVCPPAPPVPVTPTGPLVPPPQEESLSPPAE